MVSLKKSLSFVRENKTRMFWLWMLYQAIKGSITLTLIWIPLFLLWRKNGGFESFLPEWGGFLAANASFVAGHVLFTHSRIRSGLTRLIGTKAYWSLFSLTSIGLFTCALWSALNAPQDIVWKYEPWHGLLAFVFILTGFALIIFSIRSPNPFSLFASAQSYSAEAKGLTPITRHPVLWGIVFWAIGHIIANGNAGIIAFFVIQTLFSVFGAASMDKRFKNKVSAEAWRTLSEGTSFVPNPLGLFRVIRAGGFTYKQVFWRTVIFILLTIVLVSVHPLLLGVSPVSAIVQGV